MSSDLMVLDDENEKGNESYFKPVTRQEMETLNLFKSNLFKLQIQELLKEIKINRNSKITQVLSELKEKLENIPKTTPTLITKTRQGLKIPMEIPSESLLKFEFIPPKVSLIGSWLLNAAVKKSKDSEGTSIDLGLQMPDSLFQEKDYTNNRYFYKRAYFLAVVADALKNDENYKDYIMEYQCFQNDYRRPVLVIKVPVQVKKGVFIRLIPFLDPGFFMRSRLAPTKCNVRTGDNSAPTPHYNASILMDSYLIQHTTLINEKLEESPALREAIMLGKIWITQRSLSSQGFTGFVFTMIMVWLMRLKFGKIRKIGREYSAFQMFKITMDLLASFDFGNEMVLTENGEVTAGFEGFKEFYQVSIVDPTGTFNMTPMLSRSTMDLVQYEARLAMQFLNDNGDRFSDLFLKRVDQLHLKFDNVFKIPALGEENWSVTESQSLDYGNVTPVYLQELHHILKRGLGDRAFCIAISSDPIPSWSLDGDLPPFRNATKVTIGVILNPETCLREVEHGPDAEDKANVEAFKQLWGQRSETRRFQDGSIKEAVVFECNGTIEQRSVLVARSVAFLLSRHFKVDQDDGVTYWAGLGNKYLKSFGKPPSALSFQGVIDAYQSLTKQLRSLDLPLAIHRLLPTSDSLSYCSALIPQPIENQELVSRARLPEFLIEFETSSKWPDDVAAIETMKRAFYIRISTLLEQSGHETMATVCIGEDNESYLRFHHSSGYMFKARIHQPRVGYLLEKALKANPDPTTKALLLGYQTRYKREFVSLPAHYTQLNNLCLRYPFLGQTIRLTKRWLASHMLLSGSGIPPQVIEIICARVYTVPTAFGPPASGWTGFVRALELLESFRWASEPFIVELEEGMLSKSVRDELNKNFQTASQTCHGGISMFVATELDLTSTWWGTLSMSPKIVQRTSMLAKTCLSAIKNQLLTGTNNDISQLFLTSTQGHHAVIHLDATKLLDYFNSITFDPSRAPQKTSKFKNILDSHDKKLMELSFINPVDMYIDELTKYFGEIAMFFRDVYGGDKIAIVWRAAQMTDTAFKVNMGFNAMETDGLMNGKTVMTANRSAMLVEMERLGQGLVLGIEC